MADQISFTINSNSDIDKAMNWADENCTKALRAGPVVMTLGREERTTDQNSKGWPMWRDLSKHVNWYGEKLKDWEWKILLTAIIKKQRS